MEHLLLAGTFLAAVLYAIHRGHRISLTLSIEPQEKEPR